MTADKSPAPHLLLARSWVGGPGLASPGISVPRLLMLGLWLLLVNSWLVRHWGLELGALALVNGALALAGWAAERLLLPAEVEAAKHQARRRLLWLLRTRVLAVLYGAFLLAGSLVSSVTVLASGLEEKVCVGLLAEGSKGWADGAEPTACEDRSGRAKALRPRAGMARFAVWTSPFGRSFFLETEGFLRHSFEVYPWLGRRLRVLEDLRPAPTLLLRVPASQIGSLEGSKLTLHRVGDGALVAEVDLSRGRGAALVGRESAKPASIFELWRIELGTDPNLGVAGAAEALLAWSDPVATRPGLPLQPGMELVARFRTSGGQTHATRRFTVGRERLQDVALRAGREAAP